MAKRKRKPERKPDRRRNVQAGVEHTPAVLEFVRTYDHIARRLGLPAYDELTPVQRVAFVECLECCQHDADSYTLAPAARAALGLPAYDDANIYIKSPDALAAIVTLTLVKRNVLRSNRGLFSAQIESMLMAAMRPTDNLDAQAKIDAATLEFAQANDCVARHMQLAPFDLLTVEQIKGLADAIGALGTLTAAQVEVVVAALTWARQWFRESFLVAHGLTDTQAEAAAAGAVLTRAQQDLLVAHGLTTIQAEAEAAAAADAAVLTQAQQARRANHGLTDTQVAAIVATLTRAQQKLYSGLHASIN